MESEEKTIIDLDDGVLTEIMLRLCNSCSGLKNLIRISTTCKHLKKFAENPIVLKSLTFNTAPLHHESFWEPNGLLFKCMRAGNLEAINIAIHYSTRLYSRALKSFGDAFENFQPRLLHDPRQLHQHDVNIYRRLLSAGRLYVESQKICEELLKAVNAVFRIDAYNGRAT